MGLKVAFQGVPGAFSHDAVLALEPGGEPIAYDSFEAVFAALETGGVDRAVVPTDNVIAGPVPQVAERLLRPGFTVIAERDRPIEMALMALPGAEASRLMKVISHPMALLQCGLGLSRLGVETQAVFDTAGAAQMVASSGDPTLGALASVAAARLHGLSVLIPNLADESHNRTRFVLLRRTAA